MLIPNFNEAIVDESKVRNYLLNPAHPDNGGKAVFFAAYGFTGANWLAFAVAVREMISRVEVTQRIESPWSEKFLIDGSLLAPLENTPPVRTIWILDSGQTLPRLVTAYPRK